MGFNGMIITDSTSMNGFYAHMSRRLAVPTAIANGCDMFLFNYCLEEDFEFMKKGIEDGILTMERVDEAWK
ncbi:Beta-N-acetylglucosaminidase/beta-glucosidase [Dorea longicatena]|nr:Beta-N-acetylglucosaminidase/beta-glucosidase [Dorea longicatena]